MAIDFHAVYLPFRDRREAGRIECCIARWHCEQRDLDHHDMMGVDAVEYDEFYDVLVTQVTDKALRLAGDFGELWVPKSVLVEGGADIDRYSQRGDDGTVRIQRWWARKNL